MCATVHQASRAGAEEAVTPPSDVEEGRKYWETNKK